LEILGQSTNPAVIQTHLKKLFAGIHSVEFDSGQTTIVAMKSLDGEVVPLINQVKVTAQVEVSLWSDNGLYPQLFCSCLRRKIYVSS